MRSIDRIDLNFFVQVMMEVVGRSVGVFSKLSEAAGRTLHLMPDHRRHKGAVYDPEQWPGGRGCGRRWKRASYGDRRNKAASILQ